jgi:hypothetical protein
MGEWTFKPVRVILSQPGFRPEHHLTADQLPLTVVRTQFNFETNLWEAI